MSTVSSDTAQPHTTYSDERGTGRRPDYHLGAMNKHTDERNRVGAAWVNSSGFISIVLNPFVTLESSRSLVLTLFPADKS